MFGKSTPAASRQSKEQTDAQSSQVEQVVARTQRPQHSFISKDAKLTGDIVSIGDVTIEGTLDGKIECRSLTLNGEPSISGSVEAETVHVCGSFEGEIHAKKVLLTKTAKLVGDIFQESLEILPGAIFEGRVARLEALSD